MNRPLKNLGIGMSASASAFEYKNCIYTVCTTFRVKSEFYIFLRNPLFLIELQPIDSRPGTFLKNVWQRYLANMFVLKLFINPIARINSRPATLDLLKRNIRQGGFLVNILEFTALLQKVLR